MAKHRKHILDKFYTKPEIVDICLSNVDLSEFDTIIEPSAGAGSFSDKIPNCIALDIHPENDDIIKQDYLKFNPLMYNIHGKVLVIGNPPFGNQSSLIFKFFKQSMYADTIAFILPKSFKKQSFQNRIPLQYHIKEEIDLPKNSFTLEGVDYDIPCVFQIWKKQDVYRMIPSKLIPLSFSFVKRDDNPDISIRRVGVNAGKLFMDTNKSIQSHYFIKTDTVDEFVKKWNNIVWCHDNTVGYNSISKQEIIKEIDYS